MPRPQTAPGAFDTPGFSANDLELAKIRIGQGVEKLEAYLRCNRRLEELTHNQNEKLRKKIMTDQTFQDPRTLENFYNQNKSERKTVIETVRSDYIQTNKKLRRRIKKLDKFVNCVMYGTDKAPKEAAEAAIDASARENARVPVAGNAELMTPHASEPSRVVINACTCCVPYQVPPKEERLAFKARIAAMQYRDDSVDGGSDAGDKKGGSAKHTPEQSQELPGEAE